MPTWTDSSRTMLLRSTPGCHEGRMKNVTVKLSYKTPFGSNSSRLRSFVQINMIFFAILHLSCLHDDINLPGLSHNTVSGQKEYSDLWVKAAGCLSC